jgi:hypothetical protein
MAGLTYELFRLFGLGQLSAPDVQKLAEAAWNDGWGRNNQVAKKLARAGKGISTNANRDLINIAMKHVVGSSGAHPYVINLPGDVPTRIEIFLPHEIFPSMAKTWSTEALCLGDRLETDPLGEVLKQWAANPDVAFEGEVGKVGAFGIHYDGCQYTSGMRAGGGKSVKIFSTNVISAASEDVRQTRVPLAVLSKGRLCQCGCGGFHTLQLIFEVLAWSFRLLRGGIAPDRRHDGSPFTAMDQARRIPPGTDVGTAALVQVRGDWEALVETFRLRYYGSEYFCWQCNATLTPGPNCFHNFASDAPHRSTRLTTEEYLACCAREAAQPCHLFNAPGFLLEYVVVDSMHSADLGCFADVLGSLFWLHIYNRAWFNNKDTGLADLNRQLGRYYRENRHLTRITPLSAQQVLSKKPGYPFLKGKAAQIRHLAEFGLELATKHHDGDEADGDVAGQASFKFPLSHRLAGRETEHLGLLVAAFRGMVGYTRSLAAGDFDPIACRECMLLFLKSLSALHSLWREGVPEGSDILKRAPFALRQKAHMLQHLVQDHVPAFGNPAKFWCYRDEDFIGSVKSVCARTKHPSTLEVRVMQKIRILSALGVRV